MQTTSLSLIGDSSIWAHLYQEIPYARQICNLHDIGRNKSSPYSFASLKNLSELMYGFHS